MDDYKKKKNVVDVSCFFIFEATGDSEADHHFVDPTTTTTTMERNDVDDAESCSHDAAAADDDDAPFVHNNSTNVVNGSCFYDNYNLRVCIDDDDDEEEGEEVHSYYPTWHHERLSNNNISNGHKNSVDSSHQEFMTEMEKNKLFWETCLAS